MSQDAPSTPTPPVQATPGEAAKAIAAAVVGLAFLLQLVGIALQIPVGG